MLLLCGISLIPFATNDSWAGQHDPDPKRAVDLD
jgi:hypothetical protein